MKRIVLVFLALALSGGIVFAGGRQAAPHGELGNYPTRPITTIVPFAPGGGTDVFVRTLIRHVNPLLRNPMAVVNVDGAAGFVGTMQAFHGSNDGYTILAANGMDMIVFTLSGRTDLRLWREFIPIAWAVTDYQGMFASSQSGFRTIDDVITYARANPGALTYGTVGALTMNNINARRILGGLGLTDFIRIVPYDGGAQIRAAIMGGHIQLAHASLSDFGAGIQSGDLHPLLLVSPHRTNLAPDAPTTAERGMPDITTLITRGFYGPPGMNPAQVEFLEGIFRQAVESPEFADEINRVFSDPFFVTGTEVSRLSEEAYVTLRPHFAEF